MKTAHKRPRVGVSDAQVEEALRRLATESISFRTLARELGVSSSTLYRHLNPDHAERQRAVSREWKRRQTGVCERCGSVTHYSSGGGVSKLCATCARDDFAALGASGLGQGPTVRRILEFLADGHERSFSEIRDTLGLSNGTMSNRIYQRLLPYGLVRRAGYGRYAITDAGEKVLRG